jgi:hypothetical protein
MKKLFLLALCSSLLIFVTTINCAWAGEKVKGSATSVRTKWHPIEVGDEEGHIIAVYENTNVYFGDKSDEIPTGLSTGIVDMNVKTGKGKLNGYVVTTYPNGDKLYSKTEGQLIGNGQAEGTAVYIGGTGKRIAVSFANGRCLLDDYQAGTPHECLNVNQKLSMYQ